MKPVITFVDTTNKQNSVSLTPAQLLQYIGQAQQVGYADGSKITPWPTTSSMTVSPSTWDEVAVTYALQSLFNAVDETEEELNMNKTEGN